MVNNLTIQLLCILDDEGVVEIDTTISLKTTWHYVEELVVTAWLNRNQVGFQGPGFDSK